MPATTEIGTVRGAGRDKAVVRQRWAAAATILPGSYFARMASPRILRLLTMLAILLMPLAMIGAPPAAAMGHRASATMAAVHCAGMPHDDKQAPTAPCCDCMVACAAIHSRDAWIEHEALAPMPAQPAARTPAIHGLHPEAATPPPRFA